MDRLPVRKRLRLADYDYSNTGYYFITVCTKGRKQVLSDIVADGSAKVRLKPWGKIAETYLDTICGIDKYVIMPNHIHMIVHKTNGKDLSSDIRSFKILATKKIGCSIWQTSFYEHIIRNREDYLEKWRYIEENPLKWACDEYNA